MSYLGPELVRSPKNAIEGVPVVVWDGGEQGDGNTTNHERWKKGWSLATLKWHDKPSYGMRWNGYTENPVGTPQSRGVATWFILPDTIGELVEKKLSKK